MTTQFLAYKDSLIAYYRFGEGADAVLCFHGYGEDATHFSFLAKNNERSFFLAVDLPFHGRTEWREPEFRTEDLCSIVTQIFVESGLKPEAPDFKFSLMGFSLGGRMSLGLYEKYYLRIKKLILLAPDGLKMNFWYWFATQTWIGKRLFSFTMKYPGWFFGFLKLLKRLGFVNISAFKFVSYYINDPPARIVLYNRWISLRKIRPRRSLIRALIRKTGTRTSLIYGQFDRIILSSVGEKFRRGIEEQCSIKILPCGHQVLQEKHASEIAMLLRND